MTRVPVEEPEILANVICSIPVKMVDDLCREKEAPEFLFHHKPMLANVTVTIAVGMLWALQKNITIAVDESPAFPPAVLLKSIFVACVWNLPSEKERLHVTLIRPELASHL